MTRNDIPLTALIEGSERMAMRPFSRRAFFKLTAVVGALTFIGATPDGRIQAWADEEEKRYFVVYILSKEEVPIMVYDVSGGTLKPLEGAEVTIASLKEDDLGKSVTRTTDSKGFIPMNIRSISWQRDDDSARVYNLYASITVKKDGYRENFVACYFVEAGTASGDEDDRPNAIQLATQPLDGKPYLRRISLDGEDIQYEKNLEAKVWSGNDYTHDLVVEVVTSRPKTDATVSILIDDVPKATKTVTSGDTAPYIATAVFSEQWLRMINVGQSLAVSFREGNGTTLVFASDLKFGAPEVEETALAQQNARVSFGYDPDDAKNNVTFHGFLNRSGDSMSCVFPVIPLTLFVDAHGRFGFAVTIAAYNFLKDHNGSDRGSKTGENLIKSFSGKSLATAFNGFVGDVKECAKNVASLYKGPNGSKLFAGKGTLDMVKRIQLDAVGFGYAYKQNGKRIWNGDIGARVTYLVNVVYTLQLKIIVVPVVVTFDGSFDFCFSVMFGMQFTDGVKNPAFPKEKVKPQKTGVYSILLLKFEIGASVALGVAGIASGGVRGYGYIMTEFDTNPRADLPCPHGTFKLGANFDLILQFFFIKKSYCLSNFKPWVAADNWNEKGDYEPDASSGGEISGYVTDKDLPAGESTGKWEANTAQYVPTYSPIQLCLDARGYSFYPPKANNLFAPGNDENPPSPVNGLSPATQTLLYGDCFSNPRMRIVHTDTKSFAHDRAFMIRVVTTEITVPATTGSFKSFVEQSDIEKYLVVTDSNPGENSGNVTVGLSDTAPGNEEQKVIRTRIAVNEWIRKSAAEDGDGYSGNHWGTAHIVDFVDTGEIRELDRLNSHDIDFDVDLYDGNLLIAITSTQRPGSVNPTLIECESKAYLSLVKWDIDKQEVVAAGSTFSQLKGGMSLFHPRILMQKFDNGTDRNLHAIVYSYACTYTEGSTGKFRNAGYLAATVFDDMSTPGFSDHRFSNPTTILSETLEGIAVDDLVVGTFEVASPKRDLMVFNAEESALYQTTTVFSWSHQGKTDTYGVRSYVFCETFSIKKVEQGGVTTFEHFTKDRSSIELESIPYISKLGVSNQRALFNYADFSKPGNKKKLKTVTFDQNSLALGTLEETGDTDKTQYFASFNGRRLYCVRTIDGENPGVDAKTAEKAREGAVVFASNGPYNTPTNAKTAGAVDAKLYQLCEARWVDELQSYYDFYPIAQINFIPDNIGVICATKTYTHFTMANLKLTKNTATGMWELAENKADVYQVDVPVGLSATILSVIPAAPYAMVGDACRYLVEIANVGNAPITAITMEASLGGEVFETKRFDDLKNYVQTSAGDVREQYAEANYEASELNRNEPALDEDGNVCATTENDKIAFAGILWPGKRRTYKFDFTVPSGKGLEKDVTFGIRIAKVEDHMDDGSFAWPEEMAASQAAALSEGDVPLLAPEGYLYDNDREGPAPALEFLADYAFDMEGSWTGEQFSFTTDIGPADYAEDAGGSGRAAKTGDGDATAAVLAAGAAAVGAAAVAMGARNAADTSAVGIASEREYVQDVRPDHHALRGL